MENELFQLWRLVAELWDQLAQNRAITASLQAQAGSVKVSIVSAFVRKAQVIATVGSVSPGDWIRAEKVCLPRQAIAVSDSNAGSICI